ncbi:MAG: DUF547 domain-containing protein [Bacteroidetes bacterium]|nr:DUF547 domain-containing protein [Bacteroidota bacterium]
MKQRLYIPLAIVFLTSCGGSKKVVKAPMEKDLKVVNIDTIPRVIEVIKDTIVEVVVEGVPEIKEEVERIPETVEIFNHSIWNTLLQEHVSPQGIVNYEGFRQQKGVLREYISSLGVQMPSENWTQEDKLAYWMNAYNAMTVDLILRNLPLESIKDIDKPWNQRLWKLGNKWYNLDEIEHQILRKMNDPRIHFGINCASFSCPPILNEAFTSQTVDTQLEALAKRFINDTKRNIISEDLIQISKIFNWFAKDFKTDGNLIDFLNKYSDTPINKKARKSYKDYDWSLNN